MRAQDISRDRRFDDVVRLPKVEIYVTDVCNNRCSYCDTGWENTEHSRASLKHVPREKIRAHLVDHYANGARRVVFAGGEPTVRRDLGDLVADAREVGYEATTVFTNARVAASPIGARWLSSLGVTWFQVSVQGGTAAAHDASVVAPRAFGQTVAGARRLLALGHRVKVNGVLTVHLLDTLAEFAALMVDLCPEEVGLDVVRPSPAFAPGRAVYGELLPPLSKYSSALRNALVRMNDAGVVARVVSCPPCIVRGAEQYVSEEQSTSVTQLPTGEFMPKLEQRRSLQVKSEACVRCAYNASCPGLFAEYAARWGTSELEPMATRHDPDASTTSGTREDTSAEDTALTHALRALFASIARGEGVVVEYVRRMNDGTHRLECSGPAGPSTITLDRNTGAPAYARTTHFAVSYRGRDSAALATVDALVRVLRARESSLAQSIERESSRAAP